MYQICLKVDPIALNYTAMVIVIGPYWYDAIGHMATTNRENVTFFIPPSEVQDIMDRLYLHLPVCMCSCTCMYILGGKCIFQARQNPHCVPHASVI